MAKKKKNRPAQQSVPETKKEVQKTEDAASYDLKGFHPLLLWVKAILIISLIGNIVAIVYNGVGSNDVLDLIVNAVFLVLMILSFVFHQSRKGVYLFFAYGAGEILYQLLICLIAYQKGVFNEMIGNRLFEYTVFTAVILIPVFIYYKNRMHLLKP